MPGSRLRVMILSGGRGERFWPLSRRLRPKPFLDLGSGQLLLRETFRRATLLAAPRDIRVVVSPELASLTRREIRGWGAAPLLVEPVPRNTGPATLLAVRSAWVEDPRCEVLILPSDQLVDGDAAFRRAVKGARTLARRGYLVTFGMPPSGPSQEFGYLVPGAPLGASARRVRRFVEKPAAALARRLLRRYSARWNSGMFLWRADDFLQEAARCEPSFGRWLALAKGGHRLTREAVRAFRTLPALPVDRAVLERSSRVAMIPGKFRWSDLGSWASLYDLRPKDRQGNARWGKLVAWESRGNLAVHPKGLTVLAGVKDLMVVCAGDVVMACPRRYAGRMREVIRQVREGGYPEYL